MRRSSTPGATRTTVDPRRAGPDPLSGVTGRPDVFTVPVHSFREAPHNGRVQRDPCDDVGGHVRAPIEPLARAIERGPQPARFLEWFVRETPARCDLIDMFLGWRSQALISARRRCGRNVTQESCARVRGTSLVIWHQHASRGTRDGASGPLLECGSPDLLGVHAIHASCQSVGLSSCVDVGHCIVSSCDKKSDISPSCARQARAETQDSETRPTQRANARSRHTRRPHMRTHD